MSIPQILVITGEPESTLKALHDACAEARAAGMALAVAQLVPLANPALLGDPHAYWSMTCDQQRRLDDYAATAQDYGVDVHIHAMQTVETRPAMIQLVEMLHPLIAYVPAAGFGPLWWRHWRELRLAQAFAARGCGTVWFDANFKAQVPAPSAHPYKAAGGLNAAR